jgi:hypothetical protein
MTGGKYSGFPRAWAVQPLPFPGIRSGLINWTPLRPALRVLKVLLDLQHVLLCPYLNMHLSSLMRLAIGTSSNATRDAPFVLNPPVGMTWRSHAWTAVQRTLPSDRRHPARQ